jgi:hypothetical protein
MELPRHYQNINGFQNVYRTGGRDNRACQFGTRFRIYVKNNKSCHSDSSLLFGHASRVFFRSKLHSYARTPAATKTTQMTLTLRLLFGAYSP